jgi:hypothetical protein
MAMMTYFIPPRIGAKDRVMDCKYFDGCSAPLCPKDGGIAGRAWFPDEDICRLADVPEWVKRQRKVAKKSSFEGGYFTAAMLKHECRISRGMKGIDPNGDDRERARDEAAWFKAHPAITAEEHERNRARGIKNKVFLSGNGGKNDPSEAGPEALPGEKGIQVSLSGDTP